MLWVALHFPGLSSEALAPLAGWACQFTPKVALAPPDALLAEVEASLRYFGGQEAFLAGLRAGLEALGMRVSLAVAPTGLAALWRARGGGAEFAALPLGVTGFDLEFFRGIGIATVGEALALPRGGLAQRCGEAVLHALDRACGRTAESYAFFVPPARFSARLELPGETAHAQALLFPARRLLAQLAGLLAARHEGLRAFTLRLIHFDSSFADIEIRLASSSRDAMRFARLLQEKLGEEKLRRPVEALELQAAGFEPLGARSGGLFGDAAAEEEEDWSRLVERLRMRLGAEAVCGLATQPDHRPEHAWRRVEPGEWDPREFRQPGARPLWLLEESRRLAESEFTLLGGPERIECGWWDGDEARRDYFIAEIRGSLGWVYRESGDWYLHGLFA